MSDQPKPKNEWTVQKVEEIWKANGGFGAIADAHNASRKPLLDVLRQVDIYGEALIAREYDPHSFTVIKLVADARAALETC